MGGEASAQVFEHDKIISFPGCKKKAYVVLQKRTGVVMLGTRFHILPFKSVIATV